MGYDIADEALRTATHRYPHVHFICGEFPAACALRGQVFDVVVCSEAIEHVRDQAALIALVDQLLCTPGYLILTCPNRLAENHWWTDPKAGRQPVERWLTVRDIGSLLGSRFTVLSQESFVADFPGWFFPRNRSALWARLVRRGLHTIGWDRVRAAMGYGLYLITCAEKRR